MTNEKSRPVGDRTASQVDSVPATTKVEDSARTTTIEQAIIRPPEYGSAEWRALPTDDPRRQAALVFAADCWAVLNSSPHVADVLAELCEWLRRANFRDISSAISAAADWRALAEQPTFAELERRRAVPAWVTRCLVHDEHTGYPCDRVLDAIDHPPTGRETCSKPVVNGAHPKRVTSTQAQRRAA